MDSIEATREATRKNPRFNVQWPMLYRGEDFIGKGTVVDLSLEGAHFAGTMPVAVGMRVALFIDSPQKNENLIVEEAVVTWVNEEQFGTRFHKMRPEDMHWLRGYLEAAERRHSFRQLSGLSTDGSNVAGLPLALALKG